MPANPTAPANPATSQRQRPQKFRVPLLVQFSFFVVLTISSVMLLTTWLTYRQQEKSLREEVIKRGATIARSLASSAAEAVLNDLVCAALIHETMPLEQPALPVISLRATVESLWSDVLGLEDSLLSRTQPNAGVVEVLMTDINDQIVAHNDIQMVARLYTPPLGVHAYTGETILVQPYLGPNHEKRVDIAVPILVNRSGLTEGKRIGTVHLAMSQTLVESTVRQAAIKLILVMLVVMFIGTLAAIVLAQFLTRPVHKLVGGVMAIAAGNLNQRLKVQRNDELGDLTMAFNEMAASLREKEVIKGAFSTYVSSQVMEEVLKDPGKLALGGARKRATMMFSDIRGFTSLSETLSPEDVVKLINVYLTLQTEIVLRNGGMLDKFVGDCVMAVYGIPLAKPDDALRAVRTAVEIQHAMRELNAKRKTKGERTVSIGIGINTGDVVSGNMGSPQKMDYTCIGDAVNLAARLESIAEGGSILVSEATYLELKDQIIAEKLSPLPIKGKKENVLVYRVSGLKA